MKLSIEWKGALFGLVVIYLTGPLLLVAYGIQRWATASTWDWRDRWASIRVWSVVGSLCFALLVMLFLPPFRVQAYAIASLWQHVPLLGPFSLWPPGIDTMVARWLLALPLAPITALLMEHASPRSWSLPYRRVVLPGEIPQPEVVVAPSPTGTTIEQTPKRRRSSGRAGTESPPRKKRTSSESSLLLQAQSMKEAKPPSGQIQPSLWTQIDDNQRRDDDPAKQQAWEAQQRRQSIQHTHIIESSPVPHVSSSTQGPVSEAPLTSESLRESAPRKKRIDWSKVVE